MLKNKKTKLEIRKELEELRINRKRKENTEMLEKVNNVATGEDAAKVAQEFEQTIKNKECDIMWLNYL